MTGAIASDISSKDPAREAPSNPFGLHRVLDEPLVLPQAARRLDAGPKLWDDEVLIAVERLNLDAASFRQLETKHHGDGDAVRAEVLQIVAERGKMQNPVTGSGGMLVGTVAEVGPKSPLGLRVGDRVATLVSLSLTPLTIGDGLSDWDGRSEQVPCRGTAVLFARSIAAVIPEDLPAELSLAVMDVCGAPALTARVVEQYAARTGSAPSVAVIGGAGKSGSMSLAAAQRAGAGPRVALVRDAAERDRLEKAGLAEHIAVIDARDPVAVADATRGVLPHGADVTVVCVDVPGCEGGAILATAEGGTIIFFSMATSFSAAALGAEGVAADVTMLIGNGYLPGHAAYAMDVLRDNAGVRALFEQRL